MRSTGSGMGCPDWPKCFGAWVPPTHVSQLPENYLEIYKEKRIAKNQKLGEFLDRLGYEKLASDIFAHPSSFIETEFNVTKTWIEYLNRLVGALIGVFIFLTFVFSFAYWKRDRAIVYLAFLSFVLVGVQGWLGSLVVSTNLLPEMVTWHMALALLLVALLIYVMARSQAKSLSVRKLTKAGLLYAMLVGALGLSFWQIMLGTQVREQIDMISFELGNQFRDTWVSRLGTTFYIHRSFSIGMLLVNMYLGYLLLQLKDRFMSKQVLWMLGLLIGEILIGISMAYFAIPAFLQPLHLFIATLIFGVQMMLFITYYYATRSTSQNPVAVYSTV